MVLDNVRTQHHRTQAVLTSVLYFAKLFLYALTIYVLRCFTKWLKIIRIRSVKHNYLLVNYNDMFRPTQRPSSGYRFRDYC